MIEEWRTIPTATKYEVSSLGRVRRVAPYRSTTVGRILSTYLDKDGYEKTSISFDGKGVKKVGVHQLVALAFKGPPPKTGMVAAHGDGNRAKNVPDNVRWATYAENTADRKLHGTYLFGETNPNAKLAENDVILIRWKFALGEATVRQLAFLHGLTDTNVRRIISRKNWKHLEAFA